MSITSAPVLPASLTLGAVHLDVADLPRAVAWYERSLGLHVHEHGDTLAMLGDGTATILLLHEDREATKPQRTSGLYHYALLYPSREDLARAALRLSATGTPIEGASDHGTHEAIYLPDADGNGIELAADRPRAAWPTGIHRPDPLQFEALMGTIAGEPLEAHVRPGLRVGHLHLHVGDVDQALAFYRDLLGFEVQANLGSAAFVSAGGYHHHLGFNVWNGKGAPAPPPHSTGLHAWTIVLPDAERAELRARLEAAGHPIRDDDRLPTGSYIIEDPWGTTLVVSS